VISVGSASISERLSEADDSGPRLEAASRASVSCKRSRDVGFCVCEFRLLSLTSRPEIPEIPQIKGSNRIQFGLYGSRCVNTNLHLDLPLSRDFQLHQLKGIRVRRAEAESSRPLLVIGCLPVFLPVIDSQVVDEEEGQQPSTFIFDLFFPSQGNDICVYTRQIAGDLSTLYTL
jgi:hypothetical protein